MTTPEGPPNEAVPGPDVFEPAPIVPLGANEPEVSGQPAKGQGASSTDGPPVGVAVAQSGDAGNEAEFWRREVLPFGDLSALKKPLPLLGGVLVLEAALAITAIVGTFLGLSQNHSALVIFTRPGASREQPIDLATLRLTVFVGVIAVAALLAVAGSWTAVRIALVRGRRPGPVLRNALTVALIAQPVAVATCVITYLVSRPPPSAENIVPIVVLPGWVLASLQTLAVVAIVTTLLAAWAFGASLKRPSRSLSAGAIVVVVALALSATAVIPYSTGSVSSLGFWKLGPVGQTGLFDRIDASVVPDEWRVRCPCRGLYRTARSRSPLVDWNRLGNHDCGPAVPHVARTPGPVVSDPARVSRHGS